MSKTLRTLAICLAALILLGGTYGILLALLPEEQSPDSSSSNVSSVESEVSTTPLTYMYEHSVDDFVSAEITSVNVGVYHLKEEGTGYAVDELKGIPHYTSMLETCAATLSAYPYTSIVTEAPTAEELNEYGLAEPQAKATVTFENGSETLYVGKRNDDGYFYLRVEGSDRVYLAARGVTTYFVNGYLSFINTSLFYCAEDYRSGIDNLVFSDSQAEDPVCIGKTDSDSKSAMAVSSSYCIVSPIVMGVDTEALDTGLTELSKLSAEAAVEVISDSTDLSKYGLDDPRYTLSFTYQKPLTDAEIEAGKEENDNEIKSYKFFISDADEDGYVFIMKQDSNLIMTVSTQVYSFFGWTFDNMAGETFLSPMIKYLDRMVIDFGGKEYSFELTSGDGSITAVSYLDRQLDTDNFKKFYQVVLGTGRIGMGKAEENANMHMEIRFDYHDDLEKEDDVLTFKEFSLRQYAVEVNGVGRFTVAKTRMDKVENDLKKVINNEPVNAFMN